MIYRRCGCRDERGKPYGTLNAKPTEAQLARACPKLVSDPKHGKWGFYLSRGFDASGKRLQIRSGNFDTKRDAQRALAEAASQHHKNEYVAPTRITLAEYADEWLPRRVRSKGLSPNTASWYRRYIENHIKPSSLGRMKLTDIRRVHVVNFIDSLDRGAPTVTAVAKLLTSILGTAVHDELVGSNHALGAARPKVKKRPFNPWEPTQVGQFLDVASQHRLGALFELAVFTGMRRGELVGLRWIDVDLTSRTIRVENTRTQSDDGVIEKQPKTDSGHRTIQLDDAAVGALFSWKLLQDEERAEWSSVNDSTGYVFTMEDGRPLKPPYVTNLFKKLRAKAGLPEITLHGLRHEHASLLLASGADIALISKRLGHKSIGTTADIYSHLIGDAARKAAENASALVPRNRIAQQVHNHEARNDSAAIPA